MERLKAWFREFRSDAREWARGRFWPLRALLLLYFGYVLVRHLGSAEYGSWFGGINLGIHELGHVVFSPFGMFIGVLGGSLLQVAVPFLSFWIFHRQGDYFAHSVAACWLGTSLYGVGTYIGDARSQELPLVSPFAGEEIIHDWYYLLGTTGLARLDSELAFLVRVLAFAAMAAGLAWGGWLISVMAGWGRRREIGGSGVHVSSALHVSGSKFQAKNVHAFPSKGLMSQFHRLHRMSDWLTPERSRANLRIE